MQNNLLHLNQEITQAHAENKPVVALESTLIAHGLPWPENLQCAQQLEQTVRDNGAVPATIGVIGGRIKIGLDAHEIEYFAGSGEVKKLSRRDLAAALANRQAGATTVAATMICAHLAGIAVFATGGIGGVHRGAESSMDISADLNELGRTPIAVVCAGAKSILDLPKTLEVLETKGVPVIGYACDDFPAFYLPTSKLPVSARVENAAQAARLVATQQALGLGGLVIAAPIPQRFALAEKELNHWLEQAQSEADSAMIRGKDVTPHLLASIVRLSNGRALQANMALVQNNARIAAQIAAAMIKNHRI